MTASPAHGSPSPPPFATTRWTMVMRAAAEDPAGSRPALSELFHRYRHPLYAVARTRGMGPEDASDAVQEFFCQLLEGDLLRQAEPQRGRFRAFLMTAWRRFLVDQYRRETAVKRGGRATIASLNGDDLEAVWQTSGRSNEDPELIFNRQWAESLIEAARQAVLEDYGQRGRLALAETLFPLVTTVADRDRVATLAAELRMTPTAVKVALHRLRMRFGETMRMLVAETVEDPLEIDAELDALLAVFPARS